MRPRLILAMAIAMLVGLLSAAPAAAVVSPITFFASMYSQCLNGTGPASMSGTISLLDAGGGLLQKTTVTSDGTGAWSSACFVWGGLQPGLRVKAVFGATQRTLTIPTFTVRADRASDVLSGVAPASTTVTLQWTTNSFISAVSHLTTATSSASGSWSKDVTSLAEFRGGDYVTASFVDSSGDTIVAYEYVPQVVVVLGSSAAHANLLSGTAINGTLETSGGAIRARLHFAAGSYGYNLDGQFATLTGVPVMPAVGNVVRTDIPTDGTFTVGNVTAKVTTASDLVSGACPAGRYYRIEVVHASPYSIKWVTGTCASNGTYGRDLTSTVDIVAGDRVTVMSRTIAGDVIERIAIAG